MDVPDEEWVEYALARGRIPLCKDGRIKGRAHEREPIDARGGPAIHAITESGITRTWP